MSAGTQGNKTTACIGSQVPGSTGERSVLQDSPILPMASVIGVSKAMEDGEAIHLFPADLSSMPSPSSMPYQMHAL